MLVGLRSRKHIAPFELVRPASVDDVCRTLAKPGRSALMAGGLDLIDRLKCGEAVDRVIHLAGIPDLSGIRRDGDVISVGALTTHNDVASSTLLRDLLPDMPAIWSRIANPRVRRAGTLGGNLMSAMPHYDVLPAFLALGADALTTNQSGARAVLQLGELGRRDDIILERVRIPVAPFHRRLLADRSLHPIVSLYLGASIHADEIRSARIAVGCAYAHAAVVELPLAGVSVAALGASAAAIAHDLAAAFPEPIGDGLASGPYRRRMIEVLARRLLIRLGSRP